MFINIRCLSVIQTLNFMPKGTDCTFTKTLFIALLAGNFIMSSFNTFESKILETTWLTKLLFTRYFESLIFLSLSAIFLILSLVHKTFETWGLVPWYVGYEYVFMSKNRKRWFQMRYLNHRWCIFWKTVCIYKHWIPICWFSKILLDSWRKMNKIYYIYIAVFYSNFIVKNMVQT